MRKTMMALAGIALITVLSVLVTAQNGGSGRPSPQPPQAGRVLERRPIQQPGFGVEVLSNGWAHAKYPARGRVYVEAIEGEEYALRLTNPLPVRVAVALSVDGLNTIDARRTTARDASKWVIPAYGSITVTGWQMSSSRARRFYFTNERDSYANKLGRASDTGIITAVFFRERRERAEIVVRPPRPYDSRDKERGEARRSAPSADSTAPRAGSGSNSSSSSAQGRSRAPEADDDYAATGIGRSVNNDVWRVEMDLEPSPAAEISLRYEFRDALVRLGVLPRDYPRPDSLRRRERARGFEDGSFSPEP